MSAPESPPRTVLWRRFTYPDPLPLIMAEIADDLDQMERRWEQTDRRIAKLTGIATGLLISVTTGVLLLAFQIIVGRG